MSNKEGQFDPAQYRSVEAMPDVMQKRFRNVNGGFVRATDKEPQNIKYDADSLRAEAELTDPEAVRKMNELLKENDSHIFAAAEQIEQFREEYRRIANEISAIRDAVEYPLREWSGQQLQLLGHGGYLFVESSGYLSGKIDGRQVNIEADGHAYLEEHESGRGHRLSKEFGKEFRAKYQHCAYGLENVVMATDAASAELQKTYKRLVEEGNLASHTAFVERERIAAQEAGALQAMTPSRDKINERMIIGNLLD